VSAKTNQNEKTSRDEASFKKDLERQLRAQLAAVTGGLAPEDYAQARWDWYFNLTKQPDKQLALVQSAFEKALDTWQFAARAATGASMPPEQQAPGFIDPAWNVWPFNVYAKSYTTWATWLQEAVAAGSAGPDRGAARLRFATQQVLDAASPANFLPTNPELLNKTVAESGH
jgi:polyhydroxyalkanoate synthase